MCAGRRLICRGNYQRHLEAATRTAVTPHLRKLTEDTIARVIFNPKSSDAIETIQSLIILSLWPPTQPIGGGETRDGRLLIASAVSIALNQRLDQASSHVTTLHERRTRTHGQLTAEEAVELAKAMEDTRLVRIPFSEARFSSSLNVYCSFSGFP